VNENGETSALPVSISSADSKAKGTGYVEPKALPKLSGDGGNGHCGLYGEFQEGKCRVGTSK